MQPFQKQHLHFCTLHDMWIPISHSGLLCNVVLVNVCSGPRSIEEHYLQICTSQDMWSLMSRSGTQVNNRFCGHRTECIKIFSRNFTVPNEMKRQKDWRTVIKILWSFVKMLTLGLVSNLLDLVYNVFNEVWNSNNGCIWYRPNFGFDSVMDKQLCTIQIYTTIIDTLLY